MRGAIGRTATPLPKYAKRPFLFSKYLGLNESQALKGASAEIPQQGQEGPYLAVRVGAMKGYFAPSPDVYLNLSPTRFSP